MIRGLTMPGAGRGGMAVACRGGHPGCREGGQHATHTMTERHPPRSTQEPPASIVVPVVEEEVSVGRETIATGSVRVHVAQTEEIRSIELEAVHAAVEIERVHVGREVERAEPPWRDGDVLVVPVYEETVVLQRRLVLREELRLHMRPQRHRWQEQVMLRRDEPTVERRVAGGTWEPETDPQRRDDVPPSSK